jgi:hypothetical protein
MEQLKPFIKQFIQYYYKNLDNVVGGNLHVVLDDGNVESEFIIFCRAEAEKNKDSFGIFLCDILLTFSEDELDKMYNEDFWGMEAQ